MSAQHVATPVKRTRPGASGLLLDGVERWTGLGLGLAEVAASYSRATLAGAEADVADDDVAGDDPGDGVLLAADLLEVLPGACAALALRVHAHPLLTLDRIAMHIGSQILDPAPYREGLGKLAGLVRELRAAGIDTIRNLDIGGGLGIRYKDEIPLDPVRFLAAVRPLAEETGLTLVMEPGRFLVGSAGLLLTTVLSRKHSGGKELVLVDAGMNDLVRPSHYMVWHEMVELEAAGRPEVPVDVVGPVCETGDFLARDRTLPGVVAGERIAVLGAGAYGFVMASSYNSRTRPAEVLVDGGRWAVVRPRERVEDLYAGETPEPRWETNGEG